MPIESINIHQPPTGGKSDFVPTQEELKTIQEKMKDPEFMKLMTEYMQTLEDPAYRKEEEEYLAQVEREAKEGGDHSFDFVFPKEAYFVELLEGVGKDREGSRVFINMCTSDKIEEYVEQSTNDRNASNWTVPVSIGRPRPETFEGKACCVYDACFHPKTIQLGERSDRFMTFLVEIAVENINSGHKKSYGYQYRRMSSSTSKVVSVGQPQNMTVKRNTGGKNIFDMAKGQSVLSGPTKFGKDGSATVREAPAAGGGKQGYSSTTPASSSSTSVTSSTTRNATAASSSAAPATNPASTTRSTTVATSSSAPSVPADKLPPHTITHRGVVDLTDTWNWKVSDKRTGVPKQLVVTATFEGVTSAAALEMDVSADGGRIDIHKTDKHPFYGSIVLPFTVEESPSSAKFDKRKGVLTLVLDVKNQTIPQAELPLSAHAAGSNTATKHSDPYPSAPNEEDAEFAEAATARSGHQPTRKGTNDADDEPEPRGAPIDVKSAFPSMSPNRSDLAKSGDAPAYREEEDKAKLEEVSPVPESKKAFVEEVTAATQQQVAPAPAPTNTSPSSSPSTTVPSAANGFEPDANDRMAEVMRKIAEAKKQREELERAEREAEKALAEAEKEASRTSDAKPDGEDADTTTAVAVGEAEAISAAEPEVIDLRNRQAEWLKGVNGAEGAVADGEKKTVSFNEAISAAVKETNQQAANDALGGLLDEVFEEDEEAIAKKREMKRKLKEIQRQEEAAREAERLEMLMKEKMAVLPLRSRYIFDIE